MKHVVLLAWWFVVSYAGGGGSVWLVTAPPTGPFASQAACEWIKGQLTPDPRFTKAKVSECWDGGPMMIQTVPVYQ